jgi:hypothetical protein
LETAFHSLVYEIERALKGGLVALGAFQDIEGAFDNTTFESICRAVKEQRLEHKVIRWIHAMLSSWQVVMAQMGSMMRGSASWWCLQGIVLASLLWSLMADELLVWLSKGGLYMQGYSNDLVLISGKFPSTVSVLMQMFLSIVQRWFRAKELSVIPGDKMELVLFAKEKKIEGFMEPTLLNTMLHIGSQSL